jgi:LPXTG-motif cell wall-anchored protein
VTTDDDTAADDDSTEPEQPAVEKTTPATKRTVKSTPSTSAAAAAEDYTYSDDGAPDANQKDADVVAEPAAEPAKSGDKLALTGANSIAVMGGGVILVLLGFAALGITRRRRARAGGWH